MDGGIGGSMVSLVSPEVKHGISRVVNYIEDMYGKYLNPKKVKEARLKELEYVRKMGVYEICDIQECWVATGKGPIQTRWVDTKI